MINRLKLALANTKIYVVKGYAIAEVRQVPKIPVFSRIYEGNKVSIVFEMKYKSRIRSKKIQTGYDIIKLEAPFDFELCGYIASITLALARHKIPVMAFSSYSFDYLLVKSKDCEKALATIDALVKYAPR